MSAEKKPATDDDAKVISVYKMDMHCEGCAKKIRLAVEQLEGVEAVKTNWEENRLKVIRKVDPTKFEAMVEEKTKKKTEIVFPNFILKFKIS
ncbi:heavy metal-associated isoprenylated plant protein 5-like [Hevea brasiliensis]|uniref:heavy metal-associated isoprenylated plant protein 5-like n=1 Tax=Hevea brasiliensis TaxID=3981 RepID=UPI0025EA4BEC|nr:heavy metal-associated isoprenylated plant protein 5-like [Hevea brasiliensis]